MPLATSTVHAAPAPRFARSIHMKSKLILATALGSLSGGAIAQSAEVFGIMDLGFRHVRGSDAYVNLLANGGMYSSRLGFRGTEDLGGGMYAGYWLEAGIFADTGEVNVSNRFFSRRSTVSLGGPWGEVRMGRDLTPTYVTDAAFDPFLDVGLAAYSWISPTLAGTTGLRTDNAVSYFLPKDLGGVYGSIQYAFGEGNNLNKFIGERLGYAKGPLKAEVAYSQTSTRPFAYKHFTTGASYVFDAFTLSGHVSQKELGPAKYRHYMLATAIPLGASVIKASIGLLDGLGTASGNGATQFGLGYQYNLSKRTTLYSAVSTIRNRGRATNALGTSPAVRPGGNSSGFEFGLKHSF